MQSATKKKREDFPLHRFDGTISRAVLLTIVCLLAATVLHGQSTQGAGSVTGFVSDPKGAPLQGAQVELEPSGVTVASDTTGNYRFINIAPGEYTLTVHFLGFRNYTNPITVAGAQPTTVNAMLNVAGASEEVLVTAERAHGEAEAINREISAENILQVLPHDVIVSLPNANTADALGRLPSVTLERDEGEGKYVQIRGTEPRYSNVTIDGVNVPSPENVRQIKLDIVPSDLLESVEINKTLLADIDGDAIGGSVNLVTKTAGERPTVEMFGQGGYTPIVGGRGEDQFGISIGKRFGPQHKLGILGGFAYDYNGRGIDDVEPAPQAIQCNSSSDCAGATATNAPYFGTYSGADLREYAYERSRYGFTGSVDYKLSDTSSMYARLLYSHFNNFGDRWVYSPTVNSYVTPVQGGSDGTVSFNASIRRPVQVIGSLNLGGLKFFRTSFLNYEVAVGRAATEDKGYSQANFNPTFNPASPLNAVQYGINLSNPVRPRFPVQNGVNIFDTSQYSLTGFDVNKTYGSQVNLQGRASFTQNYTYHGHVGVLEIGGKFRNVHKFHDSNDIFYAPDATGAPVLLSQFPATQKTSNYYDGSYPYGPLPNFNNMRAFFRANAGLFPEDVVSTHLNNDPNIFGIDEKVSSGYIQNSITFNRFRFYAGLRIEGTNERVRGNTVVVSPDTGDAITTTTITTSSYVDPLPTAQLEYRTTPDSRIRFAYGRGLARPDYGDLPPFLDATSTKGKIYRGNPNLRPTYANNYDLLYEQQLRPLGVIQAGLFYKDITSPVYQVTVPFSDPNLPGFTAQQLPINGSSAYLWGLELAYEQRLGYLPGVLSGAGLSANYSYTNSEARGVPGRTDNPALQRQAPNSWNISPTYDKGRASVRAGLSYNQANIFSYQYQDGTPLGKKGPGGDTYLYTHLQVDAQGSVRLARGFSVFAYGLNLTNEVFGFYNGSGIWPIQREYYKPTFAGGIRWVSAQER